MNKNADNIDSFMERVRMAKNMRSKEIRLTLQESENMVLSISKLLMEKSNSDSRIIELQDNIISLKNEINELKEKLNTSFFDGGSFNEI